MINKKEMLNNINSFKEKIIDIYFIPKNIIKNKKGHKDLEYNFDIYVLLNNGKSVLINDCFYRHTANNIKRSIESVINNE